MSNVVKNKFSQYITEERELSRKIVEIFCDLQSLPLVLLNYDSEKSLQIKW